MGSMTTLSHLISELHGLGAITRPPASNHQISDVEIELRSSFPSDLREFYRIADGCSESTDQWFWDFFRLKVVDERTQELRKYPMLAMQSGEPMSTSAMVCFCDVMIAAPNYLICTERADARFGQVFGDFGEGAWYVAKSFTEFAEIFIAHNDEFLLNS